jgi:transposase
VRASGSSWSSTAARSRTACTRSSSSTACPTRRDLFGAGGRCLLARLQLPEPWASTVRASLALIDRLDEQIDACERELRRLGVDHPSIPLLTTLPGVASVLGHTIAADIGDIARSPARASRSATPA